MTILFYLVFVMIMMPSIALCCNNPPTIGVSVTPNPVCKCDEVEVDLSGSTDDDGRIELYEWDWDNDGTYDYSETSDEGDGIAYHFFNSAGNKTIGVCVTDDDDETDSTTKTVIVVQVDKIQYSDPINGYTDVSGTLYVHAGTAVTFKAIPFPSDASWPSGKPVWGGTAGASGSGSTSL